MMTAIEQGQIWINKPTGWLYRVEDVSNDRIWTLRLRSDGAEMKGRRETANWSPEQFEELFEQR